MPRSPSPNPETSSEDEDTEPIIRRKHTRTTTDPPAMPPMTDSQPAPDPEPTPTPATRKRGRPPGAKNKKGTKKSRREAEKAFANRESSAAEKQAHKKRKEEEKKLEEEKRTIKKHRDSLNDAHPSVQNGGLLRIFQPRHGPLQQQKYDISSAKNEYGVMKHDIDKDKKDNYSRVMTLWKICIRIFRCSPYALLSHVQGLVYLPVFKPEDEPPAIWNQTFCDDLSHILTHPVWDGEVEFLQTALQYAVICRTNDRRRWTMPLVNIDGGPLVRLKVAIRNSPDPLPLSVHEMHDAARSNGPTKIIHCTMSNLLTQIGETAKEKEKSKSASRFSGSRKTSVEGFLVYGVTIVDLRTIRQAIDSLERVGSRVYRSTDVCYQEFMKARNTNTDMPDMKQLPEFHRRAWLYERRRMDDARDIDGRVETGVEADHQTGSRLNAFELVSISSDSDSSSDIDAMDVDGSSFGEQVPQTQDGVGRDDADVEMQNDGWTSALDTDRPLDDDDEHRSEILSSINVVLRGETPSNDDGPSEMASPTLTTRAFHGSETPSRKSTPVLGSPTLSTQ
ncbi:hypothetical protein ACHAPJ_010090 [Fusarium lateritium]